jgi:hypothetical protein
MELFFETPPPKKNSIKKYKLSHTIHTDSYHSSFRVNRFRGVGTKYNMNLHR